MAPSDLEDLDSRIRSRAGYGRQVVSADFILRSLQDTPYCSPKLVIFNNILIPAASPPSRGMKPPAHPNHAAGEADTGQASDHQMGAIDGGVIGRRRHRVGRTRNGRK